MKRADDPYRQTLHEVAEWFGLGKSAVEEWNLSDDAPTKTKRGYNCREWAMWLARRRTKTAARDSPEYRLKMLKIEREEFELHLKKGKYVTLEDHISALDARADLYRQSMETGGPLLAPQMAGKTPAEARRIFEEWQEGVRLQLAGGKEGAA